MNAPRSLVTRLAAAALVLAPIVAVSAASHAIAPSRVANPHGKFKGECGDCHSAKAWKPARIGARFDPRG